MSETVSLADVRDFASKLSPWAHVATIGADNEPDVVPIHPCWEGDTCWMLCGTTSVKAKNVATNDRVALHWQVSEAGDGVEVWGTAKLFDDVETKRRLWEGVFDYDLNDFAPGGPDNSPEMGFLAVTPTRALILRHYGVNGTQRWSAT